jgi:hypothetical protein
MSSTSLLCEAIATRRLLEFEYRGYQRLVAPYCHGVSTTGVEVLRAIQVGGRSGSGGHGFGFGKLWVVSELANLRLTDETFEPDDPHYNPDDRGMQQIHCRIPPRPVLHRERLQRRAG